MAKHYTTAADYLLSVLNNPVTTTREKIEAAKALIPHEIRASKATEATGIKAERQRAAERAASGAFAPPKPPGLNN